MIQEIEQIIEQETENEEKEDNGQTAPEAAISEEDAATLAKAEVIGLIEIEALDIKYAVLEGAVLRYRAYPGYGRYWRDRKLCSCRS